MYTKINKHFNNLGVEPSLDEILEAKKEALAEVIAFKDKALRALEFKYHDLKCKLEIKERELNQVSTAKGKKSQEVLETKSLESKVDELSEDETINLLLKS